MKRERVENSRMAQSVVSGSSLLSGNGVEAAAKIDSSRQSDGGEEGQDCGTVSGELQDEAAYRLPALLLDGVDVE